MGGGGLRGLRVWVQLPQAGGVASPENIRAFGAVAEELGYTGVWVGDHLAFPENYTSQYPYGTAHPVAADRPFLEAFTTLSYIAGATRRIRLSVAVAVAPYRHPLLQAKTIATLDVLSGGRLEVGLGSGWLEEEFDALGVSFADRQSITDETIDVMKRLWTGESVSHDGRHFRLRGIRCLPLPAQRPAPPLWIGGISRRALRRVVEAGAGWVAPDVPLEGMRELVDSLHSIAREAGTRAAPRVSARVMVRLDGPPQDGALAVTTAEPGDLLHALHDVHVTDIRLELTTLPPRERLGALAKLSRSLPDAGVAVGA